MVFESTTTFTLGTLEDVGMTEPIEVGIKLAKAIERAVAEKCSSCGLRQVARYATNGISDRRASSPLERTQTRWDVCDRCEATRLVQERSFDAPLWAQRKLLCDRVAAVKVVPCRVASLRAHGFAFLAMTRETIDAIQERAMSVDPEAEDIDRAVHAWESGPDTGRSSLNLVRFLHALATGRPVANIGSAAPHNAEDFGRCIRALDELAMLRPLLAHARTLSPHWAALISCWAELEELYRHEIATGQAPRCNKRMAAALDLTIGAGA